MIDSTIPTHQGLPNRSVRNDGGRSPGAIRREQLFREAVVLLQMKPQAAARLDDLARSLATSRRQLQRAFAENAHSGFRAYTTRMRLEHAEELLRTGTLTVSKVGVRVGYSGLSAFSKAFTHTYGKSPTAYRKESGENLSSHANPSS